MKLIVAGGRDYELTADDEAVIRDVLATLKPEEVVTGGARGVDSAAEKVARSAGIPVKTFRPDWSRYGKSAGPIRNAEMARYVGSDGLLIAFPGRTGTAHMRRVAGQIGLRVLCPHGE